LRWQDSVKDDVFYSGKVKLRHKECRYLDPKYLEIALVKIL
jgi:hypothetical protein